MCRDESLNVRCVAKVSADSKRLITTAIEDMPRLSHIGYCSPFDVNNKLDTDYEYF
jgi:hypothetical protein